jgi:hypothetical protein
VSGRRTEVKVGVIDDDLLDRLDEMVEGYAEGSTPHMQEMAELTSMLRDEVEAVMVFDLWHDVVLAKSMRDVSVDRGLLTPPQWTSSRWGIGHEATTQPTAWMRIDFE